MDYLAHLYLRATNNPDMVWIAIGFAGQALFAARFIVQWISSERRGHSVVPIAFWYFSLIGGTISLTYAVHIRAWPVVLGQATPLLIYARNLWMILRDRGTVSA
jgi:lipid-A-disaccharide synthase-like uncharacterized protein